MTRSLLRCFTAWTCYQVQSLISINQVGLALWGWILTGALIAYEEQPETSQVENLKDFEKVAPERKQYIFSHLPTTGCGTSSCSWLIDCGSTTKR
jgi:hypothetical protein